MSAKRDYYEILGVSRESDASEVKRAYRKKAMEFHPDRNPDDPNAEEAFKEAAEAFEVLSDPEKRQLYDRFGHEGPRQAGFSGFSGAEEVFAQFGDLFGDLFGGMGFGRRRGGPSRGADLRMAVQIPFVDAVHGLEREIRVRRRVPCETCEGSGAEPDTEVKTCAQCNGAGQVVHKQGFFMVQTTCPRCGGAGKQIETPCGSCSGTGQQQRESELTIKIPAGIDDGQTMRVAGAGQPGGRGGPPGNLYVEIHVEPDENFLRDEFDVHTKVDISMFEACLGTTVKVPTLDGEEAELELDPGTQPGEVILRKGKGINRLGGRGRGDQHVHVAVGIPKRLTAEHAGKLREMASDLGIDVSDEKKGFFEGLFSKK